MAMFRLSSLVPLLAVITLSVACGSEPAAPPVETGGGETVDAATAGSLSGRVTFAGTPPEPERLRMRADPACEAVAGPNPQSDAVLIDESGGLRNAFVWVKAGVDPKYSFPVPAEPVILDQVGCIYTPRVIGLRVGQPIEVLNSDDTFHNVHGMPKVNVEFNAGQPAKSMPLVRTFPQVEVMVPFKCNVHNWMAAWVGVVDHPYFAVTAAEGSFEIPNLPPGTYTVEAWHERFGTLSEQVTLGEREAATVAFAFQGS